jgi:hypothetical protein
VEKLVNMVQRKFYFHHFLRVINHTVNEKDKIEIHIGRKKNDVFVLIKSFDKTKRKF